MKELCILTVIGKAESLISNSTGNKFLNYELLNAVIALAVTVVSDSHSLNVHCIISLKMIIILLLFYFAIENK